MNDCVLTHERVLYTSHEWNITHIWMSALCLTHECTWVPIRTECTIPPLCECRWMHIRTHYVSYVQMNAHCANVHSSALYLLHANVHSSAHKTHNVSCRTRSKWVYQSFMCEVQCTQNSRSRELFAWYKKLDNTGGPWNMYIFQGPLKVYECIVPHTWMIDCTRMDAGCINVLCNAYECIICRTKIFLEQSGCRTRPPGRT